MGTRATLWRGARGVNAPEPLARTAISNQRSSPLNTPAPKSIVVVNTPLLSTMTAGLVTAWVTATPPSGVLKSVKQKSNSPLTAWAPRARCPW